MAHQKAAGPTAAEIARQPRMETQSERTGAGISWTLLESMCFRLLVSGGYHSVQEAVARQRADNMVFSTYSPPIRALAVGSARSQVPVDAAEEPGTRGRESGRAGARRGWK